MVVGSYPSLLPHSVLSVSHLFRFGRAKLKMSRFNLPCLDLNGARNTLLDFFLKIGPYGPELI